MSITLNKKFAGQHTVINELNKLYQCENFKVALYKKGGFAITEINNERISLHADTVVLIGAFYESFFAKIEDVFKFFVKDIFDKDMTEKNHIFLKDGFVYFNYNNKEYSVNLNKLVVSSDVFCAATQAEIDGVQQNV